MGKAFLCKSNGGGGGLAFRVIGGTSAPSNPKPNDIWVNTSAKITSYIFRATEPEGYAEGMVWIYIATSSNLKFNALKKNCIEVYPISAKQYVSGSWVDMEVKTYQNGEWENWWNGELYETGNEFVSVTGGWSISRGSKYTSHMLVGSESAYAKSASTAKTENAIDLSNYSTLEVHLLKYYGNYGKCYFRIGVMNTSGNVIAQNEFATGSVNAENKSVVLNIESVSSKGIVFLSCGHDSASGNQIAYIKADKVVLK
jgi:hypothetical protein